jgi:lambda repressor-like predicted transcriptional regulator
MEPLEIKIALMRAGVTQVDIARYVGVAPPNVSKVIAGVIASARVRAAIAKALDMDVKQIWPDPPPRKNRLTG